MNKQTIIRAKNALDSLDKHIREYLTKLQDAEAAIISVDEEIAKGNYNCLYYRPIPLFHYMMNYKPYLKPNIEYKIVSYEDRGVLVSFCEKIVLVPYVFSQAGFDKHCETLFAKEKEKMAYCFLVKERYLKEVKQDEEKDKRIRGKHIYKNYTYRWTDCDRCMSIGRSTGYIYVGTGVWEDDPYSYADSPRQREVTRRETCPKCKGAQGMVAFSENGGREKESPCCRGEFLDNEHDLLRIKGIIYE